MLARSFVGDPGQSLTRPPPQPFSLPLSQPGKGVGNIVATAPKGKCGAQRVVEFVGVDKANSCVRIFSTKFGVQNLAGDCDKSTAGMVNGNGNTARFKSPAGVAFLGADGTGDLIVSDTSNHVLRKISMSGWIADSILSNGSTTVTVSLFSGKYTTSDLLLSASYIEGSATTAQFFNPTRLVRHSPSGNLVLYDSNNYVLRIIMPDGSTQLLAGTPKSPGIADGGRNTARLYNVLSLTDEYRGLLYFTDYANSAGYIRAVVYTTGVVSTIAGTKSPSADLVLAGAPNAGVLYGYANGIVPNVQLPKPTSLILDSVDGLLYVGDEVSVNVRKFDISSATLSEFLGMAPKGPSTNAVSGSKMGRASSMTWMQPATGFVCEQPGFPKTIYIPDCLAGHIVNVTPYGVCGETVLSPTSCWPYRL